jgi:hypothetical protein
MRNLRHRVGGGGARGQRERGDGDDGGERAGRGGGRPFDRGAPFRGKEHFGRLTIQRAGLASCSANWPWWTSNACSSLL